MRLAKSLGKINGLAFQDFVRRSTTEDVLRDHVVVLFDIEGYETLNRGEAVEAVNE